MKFTCSIDINKDIDTVADIFSNPKHLKHVQQGFISKELISGVAGEKDAKSKMTYKKFELTETIISNNLPDEFFALYEHKHMTNTMKVSFEPLSKTVTRYISEIHYTQFNGFLIKIISKLFPGMFKKQVMKWMKLFKNYSENYK